MGSGWGMGEIGEVEQEYTYYDEHWVVYRIESLYCSPETNITLYDNYTGIKIFNKKRYKIFQKRNNIFFPTLASLSVTTPPKDNYAEQVLCHL